MSVIQTYRWQCMECKTCTVCQQPHHEDEMMFCDKCDRGYHTFCVGMDSIPTGELLGSLTGSNKQRLSICTLKGRVKTLLIFYYFFYCFILFFLLCQVFGCVRFATRILHPRRKESKHLKSPSQLKNDDPVIYLFQDCC